MTDDDRRAQQLLSQLLAIRAAVQDNIARKAREVGLTTAQATIVQDLTINLDSTLSGICGRLGWPKSTVSRLVDDLVNKKLVVRTVPSDNRRTVIVSLVPSLRRERTTDILKTFFPGARGHLEAREAEHLRSTLNRILFLLRP